MIHTCSCISEISFFAKFNFPTSCEVSGRGIDLTLKIIGFEQRFALSGAKHVKRNAECNDAKPWVDSAVLPCVLGEAFDDASIGFGKSILSDGIRTKAGQQDRAIKHRAVLAQKAA